MRKLPPRAARVPEATRPLSGCEPLDPRRVPDTANLRTKILDFGGFDSSRIFSLRVGILMSIGDFPESLSQAILAGVILVGRSIGRIAGRAGPRTATGTMRRAAQEDPLGVSRGKNAQAERGSRLTSA